MSVWRDTCDLPGVYHFAPGDVREMVFLALKHDATTGLVRYLDLHTGSLGFFQQDSRVDQESLSMNVYRASEQFDLDDRSLVEQDPFPTVRCRTCGRRTVSVCREEDCAACDLEWLMKGVDWQDPWRLALGRTSFYGVP